MGQSDPPAGPGLEAFNAVYQRELDYVWRTLGRLGVQKADLPDAAHDVFVVLFRRWSDIDPGLPIRPWLFGVARKVAATRRRARKPTDSLPDIVDDGTDERIASRDLLWRALAELEEARRVVVVLHDLEGHTGIEIAKMLGISVNTVHSRLRLARAELVDVIAKIRGTP